jgi:hypothetical protein
MNGSCCSVHGSSARALKRRNPYMASPSGQRVLLSRSMRRGNCRTNAPGRGAVARRSRSPRGRTRIGKPTNRCRRSGPSSTGRRPHRRAAQGSPAATAIRGAARRNRNPGFDRFPRHPARQSRECRSGTSRARRWRRDIAARQDRRRRGQPHRGWAERAIQAARGEEYAGSRKVNGIRRPDLKRVCIVAPRARPMINREDPPACGPVVRGVVSAY